MTAPSGASRAIALLLPAAAALLLFFPVLSAGFIYDDVVLLQDNPAIRTWDAAWEGFSIPFWEITGDPRRHGSGYYRPLPIAAFTLLHHAGGGDPWPFHAANWVLHAACALLVAALGLRLGWNALAAGAAGMLFAVHGAHVEPVAWASSLPDLLAACFSLGALLALLRGRMVLAAAALAAALLSKEAALGTLLLAVGILALRGARQGAWLWILGAAAGVYALRVSAFGSWMAGFDRRVLMGIWLTPQEQPWALPPVLAARYAGFLVWPWPHAPFRPLALDQPAAERLGLAAAGALLLAGGVALWLVRARRSRLVLVPVGLLVAGMLPLLNVRALGQFPFEERFLYLPSAGFCLLVAGLLFEGPGRGRGRTPALLVLILAVTAHAAAAWAPLEHWKEPKAFFRWAVETSPHAMTSWIGLGDLLLRQAEALQETDPRAAHSAAESAERAYTRALSISADKWLVVTTDREQGNIGLAYSLFFQDNLPGAEESFRQILTRFPDSPEANLGLAVVLATKGTRRFYQGDRTGSEPDFQAALPYFDKCLARLPGSPAALNGKGRTLAFLEEYAEAEPLLARAAGMDPENPGFILDLAATREALGDYDGAIAALEGFLRRAPGHALEQGMRAEISRLASLRSEFRQPKRG